MRQFPDPDQHFNEHIKRSAEQYADGLQRSGLEPNPTLTRAVAERAVRQAAESYEREAEAVKIHNIKIIASEHRKRINKLKWQGAGLRARVCPPIAAVFGLVAWHNFHAGNPAMGLLYIGAALSFLVMLILGAIFDKPSPPSRR